MVRAASRAVGQRQFANGGTAEFDALGNAQHVQASRGCRRGAESVCGAGAAGAAWSGDYDQQVVNVNAAAIKGAHGPVQKEKAADRNAAH